MKAFHLLTAILFTTVSLYSQNPLIGSWQYQHGDVTTVRIYTDGFFSVAVYKNQEFASTYGGKYKLANSDLTETIEFDTQSPDRVGKEIQQKLNWKNGEFSLNDQIASHKRLDDGSPGKLAGAWLITGRFTNGEMKKNTPGARRTMKILSGTRFQWIAYNVETKEFFGTGGGTYTTDNGKYTEHIEFFSRDNTRVGASLGFDFLIMDDGGWRHRGKSSKGDPIDEVWTQREKLGI